ncbi:NUDIX hydrolase [Pseudothioclava nitratireducens]|uniref:NUDIX hydrolase n=1 Tax=Pseudothioclava nitratireducens TaxID=1928646 RepID=UPI0023DA0B54|nr:NUDIX hydrolase [Defluviimonas nitratireducens]MDF1621099.1 NUDIX hydrolase [Defluviimonas nitratireducens]
MTELRPTAPIDKTALRHAATVLIVRRDATDGPAVLMGMRGAGAAFMPSKYVFPGGALDAEDWDIPLGSALSETCARRLAFEAPDAIGPALATAAVRELWEETGLVLGTEGRWPGTPPGDWAEFAALGQLPAAAPLHFVFRAITPPGRPRRFDARFFLCDVADICGDPEDFSRACDELSHLHWVPMAEARALNLPFITEVVLAEVQALLDASGARITPPESVPFFDNSGPRSEFRRIA